MAIIQKEALREICGVNGRALNVVTWLGNGNAKNPNAIANQKWVSESRAVDSDYWGHGAKIRTFLRFDDSCKNGTQSFAITGEIFRPRERDVEARECIHDEIALYFPELADLIPWHLHDQRAPMHYVANAVYCAGNRDFAAARAAANWPEATDEQLSLPKAELTRLLEARLPDMQIRFRTAMTETCGFIWQELPEAKESQNARD